MHKRTGGGDPGGFSVLIAPLWLPLRDSLTASATPKLRTAFAGVPTLLSQLSFCMVAVACSIAASYACRAAAARLLLAIAVVSGRATVLEGCAA
jgi:hypothetical protein